MKAYCVKCRKEQEIVGMQKGKSKNGRNYLTGTCSKCGTKIFRFTK